MLRSCLNWLDGTARATAPGTEIRGKQAEGAHSLVCLRTGDLGLFVGVGARAGVEGNSVVGFRMLGMLCVNARV